MSSTTYDAQASRTSRVTRRSVVAVALGNGIEYFDWAIYTALAVIFAPQVFPSSDPTVSVLLTMATFALGFGARPLGAIYFGNIADKRGRKWVLTVTITLTSLGSLVIACIPTYHQVGLLAPALMLGARLIQGFGAGGEASSAATFLVESAPPGRRGFYGSFQQMSTGGGLLVAAIVAAIITRVMSDGALESYGWRLGFLLSAVLGFFALYLRRHIEDAEATQDVVRLSAGERKRLRREAFRLHKKRICQIFLLTIPGTIGNYMFLNYMATFASTTTGIDISTALFASSCAVAVYCAAIPLAGLLSDRIGRRNSLFLFSALYILTPYPLFSIIGPSFWAVLAANLIGVLVLSLFSGTFAALYNELFPTSIRAAASGIPFALAVAIFGGTAPYVTTQMFVLGVGDYIWAYLSLAGVVSLIVTMTLPETSSKELDS